MAQLETGAPTAAARQPSTARSVLVILVTRDGAAWLPQCLSALSGQTHPRLGVLAIDNGSSDASAEVLESALGADRVIRRSGQGGFAGAVGEALGSDIAGQADYALFLHDDTILGPDAVGAMVEAAERIEGTGVVGPKVLDWEQPRVLREIGLSTDRFGYPYSPLENGEIDQGQYDRIREVLYVSSCAMLVARQVWGRIGLPDERLAPSQEDMDFCWRARLAGFRVLMTPRAEAVHRAATVRGEREGAADRSRIRYDRERAALAGILKNYGLLTLVWILPLYLVQGLVRIALLAITRRFQDAYQVLAAWGWNVVHLPGTLRRRVRAQAVRRVPDRSIRRAMAPSMIRLRRWALAAGQSLLPGKEEAAAEPEGSPSALTRIARFAWNHPVAAAWTVSLIIGAIAYRNLVGTSPLRGAGLAAFPSRPSGFFRELVSGLRHTGLGGSQAASPALGLLGLGSVLTLGHPALLQRILLLGLPAGAAVGCYRAVRSATGERIPAVVAATCYGLSSVVLWGVSEGRVPVLALSAGLPWVTGKLALPFGPEFRERPFRWLVGAGLGLAVVGSFFPGAILAAAVVVVAWAVVPARGTRRLRGILFAAGAAGGAALLAFPLTMVLIRSGGLGVGDEAGRASFGALARFSLDGGPGSWPTGFFLPIAAATGLVFAAGRFRGAALQAGLAAILCIYLAWFGAAGYLPAGLSNPVAYVALAAFECSLLVGLGLAVMVPQVHRISFGQRQLGAGLLAAVLLVGLTAQIVQAGRGSWGVGGPERIPAAYPVAGQAGGSPYRVLWLGKAGGRPFPAPGGLPEGMVDAGAASVRFAVTAPSGASALDIARPPAGPGYRFLRLVLTEVLAGETRHGGALLSTLGIRFVVAGPGDLPAAALNRLSRQVDLDRFPVEGLTVFRDAVAAPLASTIQDEQWSAAAASTQPAVLEALPLPRATPLMERGSGTGWEGTAGPQPSLVYLAQQFDPRWRLDAGPGRAVRPRRAFGWAIGFPQQAGSGRFDITFGGQAVRTFQLTLLAALWLAALWVTRRPVRDG